MISIAVDCFGGDRGPQACVDGALAALEKYPELKVVLYGDESIVKSCLKGCDYPESRVGFVHAPEVIGCDEKPTDVIRLKRNSSMMKAIMDLRDSDEIQGMVSTGSTGALVTGALVRVGRVKGVIRPAFCPVLPTMSGGVVGVCDSGANVTVDAAMLRQFAIMGSLYMENVYGVQRPRVALLNVGIEAEKGDDVHQEAYRMLKETESINFVGNMESRDLLSGNYDLVVCDGFSGNVLIKATEGTALEILKMVKRSIFSDWKYKLGALLQTKMFKQIKQTMNYHNYGGSVLLGSSKVVVKGHGSSNDVAVEKCIEQAFKMIRCQIDEMMEREISKYEHYEN